LLVSDPLRQAFATFSGKYLKLPYLWYGKSVWKRDGGSELLFWHPSGSPQGTYYFGTKLVDCWNPEWDTTVAWVIAMDERFSNVYVPWSSHEASRWRLCSLTVSLGEGLKDEWELRIQKEEELALVKEAYTKQKMEMAELKVANQSKTDEIDVLVKELEVAKQQLEAAKQQLDLATGMLQQEWQPEETPASTTSAWMAPTPKMPAGGTPTSMSSVAWPLCFCLQFKALLFLSAIIGYN